MRPALANKGGRARSVSMQLEQDHALAVLSRQVKTVEVKDADGFVRGAVSAEYARACVESGDFRAVGNRCKVRYIRPAGSTITLASLRNASRTVRRITNAANELIGPHWAVEHRT